MEEQGRNKIKTLRFSISVDEKLQKVALKSGLTKLDFFITMVDYFYKSKKDPRDLNDEVLKKEINKKTDNIIGFIRTQEEELLRPMKKDGERMIAAQGKIINFFNENIIKHNDVQKAAFQTQLNNIGKMVEFLTKLDAAQSDKNALKKKFSEILEYYIKSREQLNVFNKQTDKDELASHVRQQLKNL
ncbi:BfmA/BtgA family mobilization protein [Mucilaginibacter sp.]|uniref:BfmA/BtgA family mobilization protein n=1 Tax=Mucilaginibacter sp. TaxID=1882438 RepID=UPI00374CC1CA